MRNRAKKSSQSREGFNDVNCALAESDDGERYILRSLAKELLALCFETCSTHGIPSSEALRLGEEVVTSGGSPSTSESMMEDVSRLARLLTDWGENPAYVDRRGRPKVLPIRGTKSPSFESLAMKH